MGGLLFLVAQPSHDVSFLHEVVTKIDNIKTAISISSGCFILMAF
jgi:hypothetical protein